ncbi:hypothetical protein [Tabrizicola sp.]|uniref:hypothetical protein n=1 Tax=Tabrizicola sp. TaxID=2005166 RepID=UPI0035B20FFE
MVGGARTSALILMCLSGPALAKSPTDLMFPSDARCYARSYTADHLARHPAQRVTAMALRPDRQAAAPFLGLWLSVTLRGAPGGTFEALASCENIEHTLYCTMEGDAGAFSIEPGKGKAVLVSTGSRGIGLENEAGFVTLERDRGDDRSFLLRPVPCP